MKEDVRAWAESRFPKVRSAGPNEINVPCPFHKEDQTKRGRLYINVDPLMDPPGLFHCKVCDERGAWNKLRKFFGDPVIMDKEDGGYDSVRPKILAAAAQFYYEALADNPDVYSYLRQRGLTFDSIESHKLGYSENNQLSAFLQAEGFSFADQINSGLVDDKHRDTLDRYITIPYFVSDNVFSIRGRSFNHNGPKYRTLAGHKAHLYNSDIVWGHPEELVICEGEFDAITMEQLGIPAVGVPGANTWQDNWTGYVDSEMVSRLYICFDNDEVNSQGKRPGHDAAEKLTVTLGGRAKIVELPDFETVDGERGKDLSDWVATGKNLDDFRVLMRKSKGGLLISVREAYEKWTEIEGNPNLAGLKFGIARIDEAIKPGLLPGQVMMTLAKTGAGKTISMLNFHHRMKREQPDKKFLFLSLEQTRNEWFERARRIHKFYEPSASIEDTICFWEDNFMLVDKNQISPEDIYSCVDQFEYELGSKPDLISLDYLGYFAAGFDSKSTYERTSKAIMKVKQIAKDLELPIYTPHQVSRLNEAGKEPELNDARDSGVTEETSDYVMALWSPDQRKNIEQGQRTGDVSMKILKSRHGGVGTKIDMLFTPKTLAMIPDGDPLHYKAQDEIRLCRLGDDLDTVVYRNLTGWDGTIATDSVRADMERLRAEGFM